MKRHRYRYRPKFTVGDALRVGLMVGTCLGCSVGVSWAGPEGGVVAGGSATIAQAGNSTTINQASERLLVDWNSFNVGSSESVRFNQPGSGSIAINRIHDANPSTILGSLSANGQVMLINPNGVVFGTGSQIDVGSLVVSTASPTEQNAQDFIAGKTQKLDLSVAGNPNARIINAGHITAKDAGLVGFVAPNVINNGVIIANKGTVQLASGDMATLDLYGDGLVDVAVSPEVQSQLIEQNGWVQADGGKVIINAAAGEQIVNSVINMGGVTQARSIQQKDGKIILTGDSSTINVTGKIDASGKAYNQHGGTLTATAKHINLKAGSTLDASGDTGGGTIKIGGDYQGKGNLKTSDTVTMDAGATIYNDAITSGDGGTTILWSDDHTYFAGNIFGRGGAQSGDGGFVETSGKANLTSSGSIDLRATSGNAGTWLIDPTNITIYNRSQGGTDNVNTFTTSYLEAQNANINLVADNTLTLDLTGDTLTLGTNRNLTLTATSGNITSASNSTLTTSGTGTITLVAGQDITFANDLDLTAGGTGSITLQANRNIVYSGSGDITTNGGAITLNSDRDATNGGAISLGSGTALTSSGGNIILGGGATPNSVTAIGDSNYLQGINLTNASVDGRGLSSGGSIIINGAGYNLSTVNSYSASAHGIMIRNTSVQTNNNGTITALGIGGGTGTAGQSDGIILDSSALLRSDNGFINLTGTGGSGSNGINLGIVLSHVGNNTIQSTSGNIILLGTGGSGGNSNNGIVLNNSTDSILSTSGNITITGIAGSGISYALNNYGGGGIIGNGSTTGLITLIGDTALLGTNLYLQTTNDVILRPYTAGTTVGIGSGSGILNISDSFLNNITYGGTLWLGGYGLTGAETGYWNSSGNMTINLTRSFVKNVNFISGADILSGGASTITLTGTASSTLWATNDINISHDLDITASGSGSVTQRAGRNIVYSFGGDITTTGGAITLNSDRDAMNGGAISLGTNTEIKSNGGHITLGGGNDPVTGSAIGEVTYSRGVNLATATIDARGPSTTGGNIVINGQGWYGDLGTNIFGTIITTSTVQTNNSGTITIKGVGGNSSTSQNANYGVYLNTNALVSGVNGLISVTGTGGGGNNTSNNMGVYISSNSKMESLGNGNIDILGTGGSALGSTGNVGIVVTGTGSVVNKNGALTLTGLYSTGGGSFGLYSGSGGALGDVNTTGNITLIANTMSWSPAIRTTGDIIIRPYTAGTTVGIGTGSGTLSIPDALLNNITYGGTLWLGGYGLTGLETGYWNSSGNMALNMTRSFAKNVNFISGGSIVTNGIGTLTLTGTASSTLWALSDISVTHDWDITASGSGSVTQRAGQHIIYLGTADITTTGGAITLNSDRDAAGGGAISLGSGTALTSNGGNITLGGGADPTSTAAIGTDATYISGIYLSAAMVDATGVGSGGNIIMNGQGWANSTNTNGAPTSAHGMHLTSSTVQTNFAGTVTLMGTGGGTGIGANNLGIYLINTTTLSAFDGAINITGVAGSGSGVGHEGITFSGGGTNKIQSNGSGVITMTGTGISHGITINNATSGVFSTSGAVNLIGTTSTAMGINNNGVIGGSTATGNINISGNYLRNSGTISTAGNGIITLNASNSITTAAANSITSINGTISLTATSGITLSHATTITSTAGNVSLNSAVTSSVAQTFSAGGTLTANAISMGANDLTLTANDLVLNGNLSGIGTLTLQPYATNRIVHLNYGSADGSNFNLNTSEINLLTDGWSLINIGRTDSTNFLRAGNTAWTDSINLRSNYSKNIAGTLSLTNGSSVTVTGNADIFSTVTTDGGSFTTTGAVFGYGGSINTNGGAVNIGTTLATYSTSTGLSINTSGGNILIGSVSVNTYAPVTRSFVFNAGNGSITFNGTVNSDADITATGSSISFNGTWGNTTALGNVTLTSTGNISLPSITTAASKTVSATVTGAGNSITASTIATGAGGNISLTADDLILNGNLSGTGTLTLQPYATSRVVNINYGTDNNSSFHLSTTDLSRLVNGWSLINIGQTGTAANLEIGESSWVDPITFRSPYRMELRGNVTGTDNASFVFGSSNSSWLNMFGNTVQTNNSNITVVGAVNYNQVGSSNINSTGGQITLNRLSTDSSGLTVISAGGNISITNSTSIIEGGSSTGSNTILNAGSGNIFFNGLVNSSGNVSVTGNAITFNGAWGGTTALGDITLTSTSSISLPSITTSAGKTVSATVTGSGNSITAAAIATGAAGNITLTADDLILNGNLSGTGTVTLQPYAVDRPIRVNYGASNFNLSTEEIGQLVDGWSMINIGRTNSTAFTDYGALSLTDPLTIRGFYARLRGLISSTETLNFVTNIEARTGSALVTTGVNKNISFSDAYATYSDNTITTNGGNVSFNHFHNNGAANTTVNTSGGNISFASYIVENITSSAGKTVTLNAGAGSITFNSTVSGSHNLTATANTIAFNTAWGGGIPLGAVSLTAVNSLSLPSITASSVFARTTDGSADLTIGSGKAITSSGSGGITLVAGRNFINQAGSGALVAGGSGRWLVYSTDVVGTTGEQDLANNFVRYSCSYGSGCASGVSVPGSGNGLVYSYTPTLTVTPTTKNVTYGDAVTGLNGYAYSIAGYLDSDGSADSVTGSLVGATPYTAGNDVGTYALNYDSGSLASALGYGFSYANKSNGVNVTARTVTASLTGTVTKIYDGNANAALAVGNYTLSNVYGSDDVSLGNITSGTYDDKNVGSGKAVSVSGLFLNGAKAGNYTLASSSISGNVGVVTPKGLTVSATTGQHKTYGQSDSTFAYGYTGLVGGDTSASFTGALARTAGNNAGTYALNVGSLAATGNYTISSFVGADYTIDKAAINVTAPTGSRTYGDSNPTYSWADATISGLQYSESGAVLDNLSFTIANSATASANAGTSHAVTLGGFSDDNYNLSSFTGGMLTIAKAPLTITADSKTRVVIMPLPTLTASFTGLRNGDNAGVVSGLTLSTGDYMGAPIGSYMITAANGTAANYDITYVNGTMTVTPGALPNTITNPILIVQTAGGNPVGAPVLATPSINTQNGTAAAIDHPDNQYPIIQWDKNLNENPLNTDPLVTFSPELKELLGLDI